MKEITETKYPLMTKKEELSCTIEETKNNQNMSECFSDVASLMESLKD
ncbi:hypothetical protein [Streptococcus sciuri]|uniref:Uncharacterized protein n=1 Tax=Streptococcus sciuri TaxID=2973939 RepID=A0ABT2F7J2_9STRE|nr:hypothetical protein [Streptococcus sciuri]MCS4488389.1 hypothetical protein [Streptococcus sciuri]